MTNPLYRNYNPELMKQRAEEARKSAESRDQSGGKLSYLRPGDNIALYYYVLPPFSDRGDIFREVWKCFNMPSDEVKIYTAWQTYELFSPGISERCPIRTALRAVEKHAGDKIGRMWPSKKVYANAWYIGWRATDDSGTPIGTMTAPDEGPGVRTVELSAGTYNQLVTKMWQPGMTPIFIPEAAVLIEHCRYRDKSRVNYGIKLMGENNENGFVPRYDNVMEKYGQSFMTALGDIPDLDAVPFWKSPSEEEVATGHALAETIRMKFGVGSGPLSGVPAPEAVHAEATPSSDSVASAGPPPWIPAAPPANTASVPSNTAAATPPPATPTTVADASVGAPASAEESAALLAAALEVPPGDIPPKIGVKPVCFKSYPVIQSSPGGHKSWCDKCVFKTTCKIASCINSHAAT